MAKVVTTPAGCWEWRGYCHKRWGYGEISVKGKSRRVHRLMWTILRGDIPDGLLVCHKCDNPPCCNPDHLWLGTDKENLVDCAQKKRHHLNRKTHCKRGHPLSGDNLYIRKTGWRVCKACELGKNRIAAGWPEILAYSLPRVPHGYRRSGFVTSDAL